ncbi:MAG: tRNA pseudouridine(38-40) synthase TruA [Nitrospiria bacterium]
MQDNPAAVIKLTLAYDGTDYHGWQKQPGLKTIQGKVEEALFRLTGQSVLLYGAGRTDAGVHALAQVAHFKSDRLFPEKNWVRGLNAFLSQDIAIASAKVAEPSFHARFSAKEKQYRYVIHTASIRTPLDRHRSWHVRYSLNLEEMRRAARHFIGDHDFTSFGAVDGESKTKMINLKEIQITKEAMEIVITVAGSRFLKYMVRNIVGFLVDIGMGRRYQNEIPDILSARDRRMAGPTAPPQGLYLVKVTY